MISTLCAFLAPLTASGTAVKAATSSITETKINVLSLEKQENENTFNFTTEKDLDIEAVTIEYAYFNDLGTKVSELINNNSNVVRTKACSYVLDLTDLELEIVALKLWKIKYQKTSSYIPNHRTEGTITWKASSNPSGFVDVVRIKTLSVTSDKLVKEKSLACKMFMNNLITTDPVWNVIAKLPCEHAYFFHFNLDNEEQGIEFDSLYRVSIEYTTFVQRKILGGLFGLAEWEASYKTHTKDIYSVDSEKVWKGIKHEKQYALGPSSLEGYDWQALVEIIPGKEKYVLGAYTTETFIEDVAIINLTYVVDGEFVEAEVLDFPTGKIEFEEGTLEKFFNWLEKVGGKYLKYIVIGLLVILVLPLISLFANFVKFLWTALKVLLRVIVLPFKILERLLVPTSKEQRKFENKMKKYESKRRE